MARSPEEHGLLFEQRADLTVFQNLLDDIMRLGSLIADRDQLRLLRRDAIGPEILGEAFRRQFDDGVRRCQDRLRRTVVTVERYDVGGRREGIRKIEDVADCRRPETIDRLGRRRRPPSVRGRRV